MEKKMKKRNMMVMKNYFEIYKNGEPMEIKVVVEGDYIPSRPGSWEEPPEGDELRDLRVYKDGDEITDQVPFADIDRFYEDLLVYARESEPDYIDWDEE